MSLEASHHDRVADAILDAAALVLHERGDAASMSDVAVAAGVGRATLYRHFPTREALLDALAGSLVEETGRRIAEAELDRVPIDEAVARLVRALAAGRDKVAVLGPGSSRFDPGELKAQLVDPVAALCRRGIEEGVLRDDWKSDALAALLLGLVRSMAHLSVQGELGVEQGSRMVSSLFLDGARRRSRT